MELFFDWVTVGDHYLYVSELWSHDRNYMTLDEERTREYGEMKKVLVKFFHAHCWNTKNPAGKYTSCAPEEKLVKLS